MENNNKVAIRIYKTIISYVFIAPTSEDKSKIAIRIYKTIISLVLILELIAFILEADAYQRQQSPCLLTMALIQFQMFMIIMTLDIQLLEVLSLAQALLLMNKIFCTTKTQRTSCSSPNRFVVRSSQVNSWFTFTTNICTCLLTYVRKT